MPLSFQTSPILRTGLLFAALSLPLAALAHTGADAGSHHGLLAGLLHPLSGPDHLAAMLAVGLWSGSTARRPWVAPLAFANLLLLGALLALAGLALPMVEPMIAASLLLLGLLLATRLSLPAPAAAVLVGGFALFHGAAHGGELAGGAALAGMLLSTVALHLAGMALGRQWRSGPVWLARSAGGLVALLGSVLLLG